MGLTSGITVAIEINQKQAMKTYREVLVEQYPGKRLHTMNGTLSIKYNRQQGQHCGTV